MRIIIAGSRTVTDQEVRHALERCPWIGFTSVVVSGTAKGADSYGEHWAAEQHLTIYRMPAEWNKYGKRAGPVRNQAMADQAEGLVAIWDGRSRGTRNMIELAKRRGLRIAILRTDINAIEQYPPSGEIAVIWENAEERAALMEHEAGLPRRDAEHEAGILASRQYASVDNKGAGED